MTGLFKGFRTIPLPLMIAVPFLVQISLSVGVAVMLSSFSGRRSIRALADQLHTAIGDRVREQIRSYLTTPQEINQVTVSAIANRQLDPNDLGSLERHLWGLHQAFPRHINHISFGNHNGDYIAVRRDRSRQGFEVLVRDQKRGSQLETYSKNAQGTRTALLRQRAGYDPRSRPWYQNALAREQSGWGNIYPYYQTSTLGVAYESPVYDANGNLLGVVATDFDLGEISRFLQTLGRPEASQVFILDAYGNLVASSSREEILVPSQGKTQRIAGQDSQNPLIAQATRQILKSLQSQSIQIKSGGSAVWEAERSRPSGQSAIFEVDGQRNFLQVMPLDQIHLQNSTATVAKSQDQIRATNPKMAVACQPLKGDLCWQLAIVTPETAFTRQLAQNTRNTVMICLIVLFGTIPLSLKTSRWMMQRIVQRSEEKFTRLFHSSPNLIAMTVLENQMFVEVNNSFVVKSGYHYAEVIGRTALDLNLWVDPQARDHMLQMLHERGAFSNQEYEFRTCQGEIRTGLLSAEVVEIDGDRYGLYVVNDITDRKLAEEKLRLEQSRSEKLLRNILPVEIAERLQTMVMDRPDHTYIAEQYEDVTILFADIVGFTRFSSQVSPRDLVALLNEIFSVFDQLSEQYSLEKIKTIGDAYMVVGGLPMQDPDHVARVAEMALAMQSAIQQFTFHDRQPIQIRIGINTGPVVAGVIGTKKFIYDLWGDAVNIAHRMESQGEIGRTQVTAATYDRLKDKYTFEPRGKVPIRGRGEMHTYWLTGTRNPLGNLQIPLST